MIVTNESILKKTLVSLGYGVEEGCKALLNGTLDLADLGFDADEAALEILSNEDFEIEHYSAPVGADNSLLFFNVKNGYKKKYAEYLDEENGCYCARAWEVKNFPEEIELL